MTKYALLALALAAMSACQTNKTTDDGSMAVAPPRVVTPATDAEKAALLGTMKSLAGTWEMMDDKGQKQVASVFSVGGAGSTVREIMFPGGEHEMTNMYHMDGGTMVMTHYCATGNQPRLRARAGSNPSELVFTTDGVTNFTAPDQSYMGHLTLTLMDQDTIREDWTSYVNGKEAGKVSFVLKRKK